VSQFNTASKTSQRVFALGSDPFFGLFSAEDIAVVPGHPESIAVSRKFATTSPRHAGVAIYDNGVKRLNETEDHTGSNVIEFSATDSTLYGYNNESTEFGFRTMSVNASGVTTTNIQTNLISDFGTNIQFESGRIYTSTGLVIDPVARTVLGTVLFPSGVTARGFVVDSALSRAFFLFTASTTTWIFSYDTTTLSVTGSVNLGSQGTATSIGTLIRWGENGLAFRSAAGVTILKIPESWLGTPGIAIAPGLGRQGQGNITISVTGHFTNFVTGQTMADLGPGITVNSIAIGDSTHATLNVSIAPGAAPGPRSLTMTTLNPLASHSAVFTVSRNAGGGIHSWGIESGSIPIGVFSDVAAGDSHGLAIRPDGTLVGWGSNSAGQINVPAGTFTAIAAGSLHSLAIRTDGTLVGWGNNAQGQIDVPTGKFIAISAGANHSLGIRSDGTLVGWGANEHGQTNVPTGTFKAIAAGGTHSLAIRSNGDLVGWGNNSDGQTDVPSGNFIAIAAGTLHSLALRADGTLVAWGNNAHGQTNVPQGTFTAIAAGERTSVGVRTDGTLAAWGENVSGLPAGLVRVVALHGFHGIAINIAHMVRDFDGDGRTDILWRNVDGSVAAWLVNGLSVVQSSSFGTIAADWRIDGTGDLNGDGKSDIVWRNANGTVAAWLMNGLSVLQAGGFGSIASDWAIEGTGDFNGDGKTDILWRNANGTVAAWLMNGLSIAQAGGFGTIASDWSIGGTGDLNGDGKTDIVWRNANGTVAAWLMDGLTIVTTGGFGTIAADWSISGTGDLNGDSRTDIFWRNANGTVAAWLMNGLSILQPGGFGTIANDWSVASTGDIDGDGKSDIVWRHANGTVAAWLMNGLSISQTGGLGTITADWTIQGAK
jgi:hypothetical protein